MKLSVVIVNYNVKYFLEQCLCSLVRALEGVDSEVYVVDNASSDASLQYLIPRFPEVNFIRNDENVGFARANNQAVRQSSGEYVLLLNPDTIVGEEVLTDCIRFMDTHPEAGCAGVKMITGNGYFLPESKRGFPAPATSFYKLIGLCKLFPDSQVFGKYHLQYLDKDTIHQVDVISGAFMLLRRNAIDQCGLLDETFFMYGEDIDLSYRVTLAGYLNYYLPYPIVHYKGESTKKDSFRYVQVFYEAMIIFFSKHYPHYGFFFALMVKSGIYIRAFLALSSRWLRRAKQLFAPAKKERELRFLILGSEQALEELRCLCEKNQLNGDHQYFEVNEVSRPKGHAGFAFSLNGFTHVVYDTESYSFERIISLMSISPLEQLELGLYSVHSKVLVTPKNSFCQ